MALIRSGANTHALDMGQRMVSLAFTKGSATLTITAPPNANVAPPGYYMLFIVDTNGVPSMAPFVRVASNPGNQPPRGTIDLPAGDVTIATGQSVNFAGSATDSDGSVTAYRWIFPGGSPATSTSATPGNVTFTTPGTYSASLTVTDNQGATDPSLPMRIITVQTTELTASFTSPADGATVRGAVNVGMAVSGASGSSNTFTLTLDGSQLFSNTTSETTQSFTWNTGQVADGLHTLGLTVRDSAATSATATRAVTVQNAATGTIRVFITQPASGATVAGTQWVVIWLENAAAGTKTFTLTAAGQTVATATDTSNGPVRMP